MRQTALIVIFGLHRLLRAGKRALIGPFDRIFTRIGASDDIARGSFYVHVGNDRDRHISTTPRIKAWCSWMKWAAAQHVRWPIRWPGLCRLYRQDDSRLHLVRHHYFELTTRRRNPRCRNVHVEAVEHGERLIFCTASQEGLRVKVYGCKWPGVAGIPKTVTTQARRYLTELLERERDALRSFNSPQGNSPVSHRQARLLP